MILCSDERDIFYSLTQGKFSQEFSNKVKYFKSDWW